MHFHTTHGINIILEENNTRATRAESFCNGITFSANPIGINEHFTIIIKTINSWSGALRLGVTTHNPETLTSLPKYACPDLINKAGFWADAISENLAANSSRITFFISENGSMQLFINNEHQGSHLTKLPIREPLWVLIDIYGNTKSVKYVPDDAVPYEILSRGPDAVRAFRVAEINGTLPVYRTRLMLLGQDGVGKTRLKQHLTGRRYNDEKTAGSIDTSGWCEIIKGEPSTWTANDDDEEKKEMENGEHSVKDGYYQAIATNIVRELIMIRHHHEDDKKSKTLKASLSRSSVHSHLKTARKDLRSTTKHHCPRNKSQDDQSCEERVREDLLRDLPDQVIDLVDSMLQEADINEDWDKKEQEPPQETAPNIMLSLWDFSGKSVYHTTHQVFLSSRAIYLLVFNLCQDLDAPAVTPIKSDNGSSVEHEESELTNLDYLVFWMNCIHAHAAPSVVTPSDDDGVTLSPPIIIVGTHKKGLHDDPDIRQKMISEKFQKIQVKLAGKPFQRHVVSSFFAVENNDEDDEEIQKLRVCIEEVAKREPYMGEEIPIKWLRFEDIVSNLVEKGINLADIDQIREIARGEGIDPEEGLRTMLHFYHDLGVIIYYGGTIGAVDEILMHTVILHPQWLIGVFGLLINGNSSDKKWPNFISSWVLLEREGLLEDRLINHVWRNYLDQKSVLLALMEKFDLLCEKVPPKLVQANLLAMEEWQKCYYVPCRLRKCTDTENIIPNSNRTIVFYLDFNGFLPDGLFHRLLTRIARWSQKFSGIGPKMYHRLARFFMDNSHDFILQMSALRFASIKVIIARVSNFDDSNDNNQSTDQHLPSPQLCAKIRNFLESTLVDLREMWIKRLSYKTCIQCPCDKICTLHGQKSCTDEICKHYLLLDECLANKVVCCDYRRIKTSFIRKCFPAALKQAKTGPIIPENIVTKTWYNETVILEVGMLDDTGRMPLVPVWVKGASKLLNAGSEGNDWTALATKLGYKQVMIDHFSEDLNPGLALITDWIYNSGNNSLSIDMLVACLNQIHRDDIVDLVHQSLVDEDNRPPVFISYHWDNQDEVLLICNRLEKTGIRCWMDIGQMGGGDHLYNKIYEGITHSKVLIACISPKYTVSHNCNREASLADLLHKPIIPVMIQPTPWPPPGPMGLLFSQLIYIDFHGTGGHGGSGIHADWESRFNELYLQLNKYTTPKYVVSDVTDMVNYTAPNRRTSDLASLRASRITLTDFVTMPLVNNEENEALPEELIVIPSLQAQNRGIVTRCTICRIL